MSRTGFSCLLLAGLTIVLFVVSCRDEKKAPAKTDIVATPEELDRKTSENIRTAIDFAAGNKGNLGDSTLLFDTRLIQLAYERDQYKPLWAARQSWTILTDSLVHFIEQAKHYGLFPDDYHYTQLLETRQRFVTDSVAHRDAALWSRADLLLTDAFIHIIKDLKLGRLPNDSITMRKDSVLADDFYLQRLAIARKNNSLSLAFHSLEPQHKGYHQLKAAIPAFLATARQQPYTKVPSPKDTLNFKTALQTRLFEGGYLTQDTTRSDSSTMVAAVKKFQEDHHITVDGKAGEGTVRVLNLTDHDRFVRIAITLDRYKMLPDTMPGRYVWVNIPGYYMLLHQGDSINVTSKIICGKPATRTPQLTSAISELITYPQWTVPTSIIVKEILPAVKKDPGYLAKKGFSLIDGKGDEIDPYTVEWSKYSKGIPYKVVQGSGDANALGILKFNFPNKYAVYLHDTNQRYLFGQTMRSLSHGCVRVQDWSKLAYSIIRYDYREKYRDRKSPVEDSMNAWLARKEKHSIGVRNRLPVYIRYFTCEAVDDRIRFYDDIYGEDKLLREKYFAGK